MTKKVTSKAWFLRYCCLGFPDGQVAKNLPANAGNMGLIPGPGKSHVSRGNKACEPQLLRPVRPRAHVLEEEKMLQ